MIMQEKLQFKKVINCFEFKKQTQLLHSMFLVLSFFCFSNNLFSQTTLINPLTDGGFNSGSTFAANGWTVANEGSGPIKWTVGTAASGTTSVGATTSGSTTVTLTAPNANIAIGQIVYGDNIPANTFVANISGTDLTLSQNAGATAASVTLGFGKTSGGGISVATSQMTSASIPAATYQVTLAAANPNITVGMLIAPVGGFIGSDTYVASINGTTLGLSKASVNVSALAVAQTMNFSATTSGIMGNAAYITNDNGVTNSYGGYSGNRTVYFYRDITTVPAAQKAMTLTFDVKSAPTSGAGWQVWVAPVTHTVAGTNTQVTSPMAYGVSWPGATLISYNATPQVGVTRNTAFIPKSFAGTSFRLIFVWTNSSAGTLPPAVIDNISLVSRIPEEITCAHSGLWSQPGTWDGGNVPTPADTAVLDGTGEVVVIDSRYSGCEDLILAGVNSLVQFAISGSVMDDFTINNDMNLAASGARFNNFDGATTPNGKFLKLGHNLDVGPGARLDSSINSTTNFVSRLTLNGTTPQTITVDPTGFMGSDKAGTNAFGNQSGVLNQLEVTNTSTTTPNIIWNVKSVRINGGLILTSGRVNVTSGTGNRFVIGNFSSVNNIVIAPGSGFTNGTVSKFISSNSTKVVQPGTEYPGTDNNYKPFWYPFISSTGLDRTLYFLPDAAPATNGEVAVTYTNANAVTGSLSIADGAYTINKRYDGNWAFSTPDATSNATPVIYAANATTATNRVGVYANGAYEAIDGSSRLMNASAALAGTHQDGTAQPFVFRNGLTLANLTAAPVYVGINDASALNVATAITSATSGNWNTASTWVGGVVPTCSNVVTIASGHNVTVSATANAAGVIIAKGGTLTNNAGASTMTVGCTNNNAAFYNYGSHVMVAGNLKVNGFVAHKAGSFFNQTGGDIIIDSNDAGNVATSVAFGGTSCKIETSNLDLTGGKITIVDPLVNIGTPISATSISNFNVNTAGAAGTFTVNGTIGAATLNTINITGTYNLFEVGQVVSGHANIVAGTKIQTVTVAPFGSPPAITLTLDTPATGAIAAGTPISYSSMLNNVASIVIEANAANANLALGQAVSGTGIQPGSTITGLMFNGLGTNFVGKMTLSLPVTGLGTSPITSQQPLTVAAVNPGSYATILTVADPNIVIGMTVSGPGIKPGTFVADITGTKLTFSEPIQAGAPTPLVMNFQSFNTQSSGSFIYASANHYAAGLNHTLQIGDGVSTQHSTLISNGFNCQFQAGGGLFSLGNLTVDAPNDTNGNSRFMNVSSNNSNNAFNMNVQNAFTVTAGSTFKKTFANAVVYVGGNIVNNGTINFPRSSTPLYFGNFINGAAVPTSLPQTISGSGTFATNQYSVTGGIDTGSFPSLTVNNTSTAGVTISVPNFRLPSGVVMTNGIVHTSAAYPIYVGNPDVTSTVSSGSFSGGSATSYIDGPAAHANANSSTIGQLRLFPVGKNGKYLPILISSTGGVELMAEAFDTNSGTVNATNASNLSTNRWKVSRVGSAGTFTGYNVRLASSTPVLTASNIIVHASADQGTYDIVSTPASAITFDAAHFSIPAYPSIVLTTNQTGGFLGNFSYAEGPACTGTPAPGATVASSASVCAGQSVALSLTTPTTGALVTYQWQSSVNAGPMTNIAGATAATYTATPSANTSYQCIVTCSGSPATSTPVAVTVTTSTATTTDATMCTSGTANLSAAGSAILNWYDAPTGGIMVAQGVAYSPAVSQTTTYYVASGSESTGAVNTTAYAGTAVSSAIFKGISFDAINNLKLKTVTVYPKNTAALTPITVGLFDANGNLVSGTSQVSFTPTLVTGTVGTTPQVVTLNYNIPVGKDYRLVVTNGLVATTNTLGNSTAAIAYPLTSGPLKLTGNVSALNDAIVATANTTNIFHNLTYDEVCEGVRVPVTATVVNTTAPTAAASQDACLTHTIADFTVTPTAGATLTWYDAPAAGNVLPTSTPAVSNVTYYVSQTVTVNSVSCEGPRTAILASGPCLGTEDFKIAELKYFPNPVNDQLSITAKDVITRVEVYNLIGQQLRTLDTDTNNVQMDFSKLASSTYLVKVYSEEKVQFFKVIKR
jgi:type IX secretion system substrate protein/Ig-like domain-containing protein